MHDRLVSLDVLRGWTIGLMLLVNHPGSWAQVPAPLRHARWHGLTPADLVFPFFLFIVGVAVSLSFGKHLARGQSRRTLLGKALRRTALIFALGLFLNGFPFGLPLNAELAGDFGWHAFERTLADLRCWGVLQRIALCYGAVALTVLALARNRDRCLAAVAWLAVYELGMRLPLVTGWGAGSFALADNFVRYLDLQLCGADHLYGGAGLPFDPEGLWSTLPAAATTMLGFLVAESVRRSGPGGLPARRLSLQGAALLLVGLALAPLEPVNKQLWTVSYVLVTSGLAQLTWVVADLGSARAAWQISLRPAVVLGSNPLIVFLGAGLLARLLVLVKVEQTDLGSTSIQQWVYTALCRPLAGEVGGSVAFTAGHLLLWLALLWLLYRKRIFWKI